MARYLIAPTPPEDLPPPPPVADAAGPAEILSDASPEPLEEGKEYAQAVPERTAVVVDLPGLGETYLDSEFATKINAFIRNAEEKGVALRFTSGYRSPAYQQYIADHPRETGVIYPPAKNSLHQAGLAIDVDYTSRDLETQKIILDAAKRAGLNWGGAYGDPNHFDFDPSPGTARDELFRNFVERVRVLQGSRMKEPL